MNRRGNFYTALGVPFIGKECVGSGATSYDYIGKPCTVLRIGGTSLVAGQPMVISGSVASYHYLLPADLTSGSWNYS